MSINLELLYGCIDYLENQFIHAVRISCLVGSTDFSILQGLEAKGFYHGYPHKHEMFFLSYDAPPYNIIIREAVYPPQICQQKDEINFKKIPFTR